MAKNKNDYQIDNKEFDKIKNKALIIDVRDQEEFQLLKKIPHSINVPYRQLIAHPEKFITTKEEIVVTICNAGHRSTAAAQSLREQGYQNAFVLITGIYGYYR
ncbi:MAG: rhodanese-like domain-containing protein [Spiroplasma sp.]|nr:rhodanese-like domain-containing protein [Spiroplasma sp.]